MSATPPPAQQSKWNIGPISTPSLQWGAMRAGRPHACKICGVILLTGEKAGFCCGPKGNRFHMIPPLPPLPIEYTTFINDPRVSSLSRKLNLIFSFASLESTHSFPNPGNPSFIAIAGKTYHALRAGPGDNTSIRWMLYDGFDRDHIPHSQYASQLPTSWIDSLQASLIRLNPLVSQVCFLHHLQLQNPNQYRTASLILKDSGANEIAAIMCYDNTIASEIHPRSLSVSRLNGNRQSIATVSRLWEPLAYPLFFPNGTLGWGIHSGVDEHIGSELNQIQAIDGDPPTTQIWHYRARLLREPRFHIFGRLTNEYVIDMFTRELETRLHYIRTNQARIRALEEDSALMGQENISDLENVYLPASFLGSWRWASNQIADSLAIAAACGAPTLFVTFTCNTEWPEITSQLLPGQLFTDIPVVVCRVFKQKLSKLIQALRTMFTSGGRLVYLIDCIEFQKRGLPHAHLLLKYPIDCISPADIDHVVSAKIPDDPADAELVRKFMIHNSHPARIISHQPPDAMHPLKYCERWRDGARICRFGYPKPLQATTTFDEQQRVQYARPNPGDEHVVAHCLPLLRKFRCHLNVEIAGSGQLFQYLFKYIHKGPDRTRFRIHVEGESREPVDEIEEYWNARYLSATEATWRIMGFNVTKKEPSVTPLSVHTEGSVRHAQYHRHNPMPTNSNLEHYFCRPAGTFMVNGVERYFSHLLYTEYFSLFRLQKRDLSNDNRPGYFVEQPSTNGSQQMHAIQRKSNKIHIARIQSIHLSQGDIFYLRALLQHRAAASFLDLRTIEGVIYENYQAASIALGLFATDNEAEYCMLEAVIALRTPREIRILLVHLLTNDCVRSPLQLWNRFREQLSQDYIIENGHHLELGINAALDDLGRYLEEFGKTLDHYGLPQPTRHGTELTHELARWAPQSAHLMTRAIDACILFNTEQKQIYDTIMTAVENLYPLCLFIDGKAGRGKTFLVNALCDWWRGTGHVVLATATSAFAAQLYPGGRTTHSTFKVPVNESNEMLVSDIRDSDGRGELIREARLIIWDEAPMANRAVLACVEEVCRRLMHNDMPFGGKVVVLLGDFRQTCPVVRSGTRAQVANASIRSSSLWPLFTIQRLITPIRNAEDLPFADLVDAVGDGAGPDINLSFVENVHSAKDLIDFVYPGDVLSTPDQCLRRAILAPTNAQVDAYNTIILSQVQGQQKTYLAYDSLEEHNDTIDDDNNLPLPDSILDYVARVRPNGMPDHSLTVKIGGVYRLLRNFSIDRGLVKNIRVVVVGLGDRLITVRLLKCTGNETFIDTEDLLIPRITFKETLPSRHTLLRRQYPLSLAYATTFHSCQGLTLDCVGIDLMHPVFTHGQLYTALSRIRHRSHVRVRLPEGHSTTTNVTFHEILI